MPGLDESAAFLARTPALRVRQIHVGWSCRTDWLAGGTVADRHYPRRDRPRVAASGKNENLTAIFDDLLDQEGSEIYMRPAEDYVALGTPVNFYTVTESARTRGEVALGYHRQRPGTTASAIVVKPIKAMALDYATGDRMIVLARD